MDRPGLNKKKDSTLMKSISDLSANPEKMGINLDEETVMLNESSRSKKKTFADDDLTLDYTIAEAHDIVEEETEEEEYKRQEVHYFATATDVAPEPKSGEKGEVEKPFDGPIIKPTNYSVGGREDDVSTIGGFNDEYAWDDSDNSTIATTLTMRKEENQSLNQPSTIIEEEEEEEEDEEENEGYTGRNDNIRQSAYERQSELGGNMGGGNVETSEPRSISPITTDTPHTYNTKPLIQQNRGLHDIAEEAESYRSGMNEGDDEGAAYDDGEDNQTFNPRAISPMTLDTSFPSTWRNQRTEIDDHHQATSNTGEASYAENDYMPEAQTQSPERMAEDDATFNPRSISPMTIDTSFGSTWRNQKKGGDDDKSAAVSKAESNVPSQFSGDNNDEEETFAFNPHAISPMTVETSLNKKMKGMSVKNEPIQPMRQAIQPIQEDDEEHYEERENEAHAERKHEVKEKIDQLSSHERSAHGRLPNISEDQSFNNGSRSSVPSQQSQEHAGPSSSVGGFRSVLPRQSGEKDPSDFRSNFAGKGSSVQSSNKEMNMSMHSLWNSNSSVYSNAIPTDYAHQLDQSADIYDLLVVGGGVVGLSVLRAATLSGYKTVLIEAESDLVTGASAGNSGIIHTGTDSVPGSLERALIRDSISQIRPFLKKHKIPYHDCGSLVCQWDWDEVGRGKKYTSPLARVLAQSMEAGDTNAMKLTQKQLQEAEPNMSPHCVAAVHLPGDIIIDPWLYCIALVAHARENGATIYTNFVFDGVKSYFDPAKRIWTVRRKPKEGSSAFQKTNDRDGPSVIRARAIVNATGIMADVVQTEAPGVKPPHWRSIPRRGQYRVFQADELTFVTRPIMPIPTPRTKGIFVFSTLYDQIVVGPTAQDQISRHDISPDSETSDFLTGYALRVLPNLDPIYQHVGHFVGVRPATNFRDYQITMTAERNWITTASIRSTGLTASLGIGRHVIDLLRNILPFPKPLERIRTTPLPELHKMTEQYNNSEDGCVLIHRFLYKVTHPITQFGFQARTGIAKPVKGWSKR
eukprot:CAMPEP_0194237444 /NCGR_PEP_ID=MMETSP0158-20130606/4451_1 /TAXON_ID=33649 /ORGANISM="Thalassionema nitzschioides, Strain L26-B" /LENGTH=1029 /DNA_ID=CAMNT_0038971477 /DNA_START=131 /DNA_END=3220 /DNA_ORIENTATION=+